MHTTILSGTFLKISLYHPSSKLLSSNLIILIYSNFLQFSNIPFIHWTFDVSKLDKFNEVNDEQPENIENVYITFDVSKLDKFNEVNDEQSENIEFIYRVFEVSKFEKSNSVISLQR